MQLYFIRHAQSNNNAIYEETSSYKDRSEDPMLSKRGEQQAQQLAAFLDHGRDGFAQDGRDALNTSGFGITHIYTSLMVRAVATATCAAQALGLPLIAWPEIHEGGGIYLDDPKTGQPVAMQGNPRSYFITHYPGLILPDWLDEQGWWNRPFEARPERRLRARKFLSELVKRHGNHPHRVAVVSHGGFYNHFLAALLELRDGKALPTAGAIQEQNEENLILGQETSLWFSLNNTGISRIDFTPGEVKIIYLNRVDFLPGELIT